MSHRSSVISPLPPGSPLVSPLGSPLASLLSGIGVAITGTASLFTYLVVHEPLESVGASVVSHLASAKCAAIGRTLTALALTHSDVLSGEPEGERMPPDPNATIGVVSAGRDRLEDFHSTTLSQQRSLAILRQLPLDPRQDPQALAVRTRMGEVSGPLRDDLNRHQCSELGYGLDPQAVRVYPVPGRPKGWMAFLYGPWTVRGQQKTAFALVNLSASTLAISGHAEDAALQELFPVGGGKVILSVLLTPPSALESAVSLHQAMPRLNLDEEDRKLAGLRIVPFANQLVSTQLSIDHRKLNRVSWLATLLVGLMGLIATGAVVAISRRAEGQLRRLNEALLRESRTDGLTLIPNRRAWDEALTLEESRRQRHGHRYALVVVDLDDFKQINDQQGHQSGDEVLQIAAARLAAQLRSTDFLARVGGDEFAMLLFNPSPEALEELVARLRNDLQGAGIRASIGVALSEERATLDQTWAKADHAMYAAKTTSRQDSARSSSEQS
jgi:diguanylate cyclase (GGDEF)-like protein